MPSDWFTGDVFLTPLIAKDKNNEFSAGAASFDPGARTHWHTHPKGQVLIVIEGMGHGILSRKGQKWANNKKGQCGKYS